MSASTTSSEPAVFCRSGGKLTGEPSSGSPSSSISGSSSGAGSLGGGGCTAGYRAPDVNAPCGGFFAGGLGGSATRHDAPGSAHLTDHTLEHALGASERVDMVEQLVGLAGLDQRARLVDDTARLVDRVA